MKKGSYLINTARGPIVEEKAVVDLLEKNHFSGKLNTQTQTSNTSNKYKYIKYKYIKHIKHRSCIGCF